MNSIVHPAVKAAFDLFRKEQEALGTHLIVKEAALLLESGTQGLDVIVVVDALEKTRIRRVTERDGIDPEQVKRRIRGQLSAAKMHEQADFIIDNSGTARALTDEVDQLLLFLAESRR
jgi:dephospho-CoA kinase